MSNNTTTTKSIVSSQTQTSSENNKIKFEVQIDKEFALTIIDFAIEGLQKIRKDHLDGVAKKISSQETNNLMTSGKLIMSIVAKQLSSKISGSVKA